MDNQPSSQDRPNIITAIGGVWKIFVGDLKLEDGESVLMGAGKRILTNAPNLAGYNWLTDRVLLRDKRERGWITIEDWCKNLPSDQYVTTIGPAEVVCEISERPLFTVFSYWGETIHITGKISFIH
ncbi:MAG: hypothetical protein UR66_C0002G0078 [Candidatus Moranbacteria bacterium GW2011_GWE1_35_17]|nr:MAG: hypothetical protein UR66_C0002G0078 [Candidatus Moranbacteria bacterium GW2011_GWE1_35_17]KKP74395.1 MAG: hypothetical protein UR65_C0001G0012 [Candidatus Moranbacteria bacterium GW2011_GWE2_35_164]KKP84121.1 MAG: hypothetical protein UR82_C0012G0017 [Candidatus Moranbacteria bacterium GW2011_GWF1_35_5]KKP85304.1 MAG: hypothetical protein UR83_C0001G0011 [Candidatus Moranbacteria bacterium GW2011_GWF2_35_54]